jgi:hypothetical protein
MRKSTGILLGTLALLLLGLNPALAKAQSVQGHAKVDFFGNQTDDEISVNAYVDDLGFVHGMMEWCGDVSKTHPTGPTDPWHIEVIDLLVVGNTAYVTGVVTHSVFPGEIGNIVVHAFTDNSALDEPDEIDGIPLLAGNIVVRD